MVKDTAHANDVGVELLRLTQPSTVLEVGFGQGRTAALLIADGHRVLGVDSSATMVRQATARNRQACRDGRAQLRINDGVSVPFPDQSADAAFTVHTIYFMPDPTATLAAMARIVKPGGRVVIACRVADDPIPGWMDPSVYRISNSQNVERMLADAGLIDIAQHALPDPHHTHWFTAVRSS